MPRLLWTLTVTCRALNACGLTAIALLGLLAGCTSEAPLSSKSDTSIETSDDVVTSAFLSSPIFLDVSQASGIDFQHRCGLSWRYRFPEIMGSGGALFDYDNDGDLDVYLVDLVFDDERADAKAETKQPGNRLFEQIAPLKFRDVTAGSGLEDIGLGQGVAIGDVNNDGLLDVYLTKIGRDRLFLNFGSGHFEDVTQEAGIDNPQWGTSAIFFDYDRDGWLDLYVANYVEHSSRECKPLAGGTADYCSPQQFSPSVHRLFHNQSGRDQLASQQQIGEARRPRVRFEDVTSKSGIASQSARGMGVVSADFNGDGWPDLHVANDQSANFLWINDGVGRFRDEAILRGSAYDLLGRAQAGMGVAVADVDQNGRWDIFETHLGGERNTLYLSDEYGNFTNAAISSGVGNPSLPNTGFGTAFTDLDLDGDLDLLIANGAVRRRDGVEGVAPVVQPRLVQPRQNADVKRFLAPYAESNQIMINESGRFRAVNSRDEIFSDHPAVWRTLLLGDLDNDGDQDCLATSVGEPVRVFANQNEAKGQWLQLRLILGCDLKDSSRTRDDVGAVAAVHSGKQIWRRIVQPGTGYLSSHDTRIHFGLGEVTQIDHIDVIWSDGKQERFAAQRLNQIVTLRKGSGP